jgi:ATP-binding cassette subfamily B protein RaxB
VRLPFFSSKPTVHTVLQNEQQECGLACMAMVANAYGHNVSMPYMRSVHQVTGGGMSLAELYNLAGVFGFDARGLAVQNTDEMDALKLPAILHWEGRHYVVLDRISRGRFYIHDPAIGPRSFEKSDFEKHFSGVVLELEPRLEMEKIAAKGGLTFWDVLKSTNGFRDAMRRILAVSMAVGVLALATPILLQISLDFVLPQADVDLLGVLTIGLCALLLFEAVGRWLRDVIILRTSVGMQVQFTRSVVGHGFRLPLRYFEARHPGDFVTRLDSIDQVKAFASDGLVRSIADAVVSVLSVALMFYYSTDMTFMVLGTLTLAIGARALYLARTREATNESLAARTDEVSTLLDGLDRIATIKAHNVSGRFEQRWFEKMAKFASRDFLSRKLQVDAQLLIHIVVTVGTVATLYAGVAAVLTNKMTIGMLYAFFALRGSFFLMADTLTTNLMHLTVIGSHVRRLEDVIQAEPELASGAKAIRKSIRKEVSVKDLTISFGRDERPVVVAASLTVDVERNERIAIIGESGSGKSSLLKVIASVAAPTSGALLIDGQPMSRFGLIEYRNNIGAVFAEDGLFQASIAENVSMFDPDISLDRVQEALSMVGLTDEVEALPQGLATIVANNNTLLSTGQRRRLLAARAICRRPRLMLFDEITANLDADTERHLLDAICPLPGGKIFVTHSERLLNYVDRAYLLKEGRLEPVDIGGSAGRRHPSTKAGAPRPEADIEV